MPLLPGVIIFNRYYISFKLKPAGGSYSSCIYLIVAKTDICKPKESVRKKVVEMNGSGGFVTLTISGIVDIRRRGGRRGGQSGRV